MIYHRNSKKHDPTAYNSGNIKLDLNEWSESTKSTTHFFGKNGIFLWLQKQMIWHYKTKFLMFCRFEIIWMS